MSFSYIIKYIFNIISKFYNDIIIYKNNLNYKKENNINKNIYLFLNDITNKWKDDNINDMNLLSDILSMYNKYDKSYKPLLFDKDIINDKDNQNINMKYYILGWYIYQTIDKDNQNKIS